MLDNIEEVGKLEALGYELKIEKSHDWTRDCEALRLTATKKYVSIVPIDKQLASEPKAKEIAAQMGIMGLLAKIELDNTG